MGELNIIIGGIVKVCDIQIVFNDKSKGDVRVDGQNFFFEIFNMYVGIFGMGMLILMNNGMLNVEGGEVYLGVFEFVVGMLNIGVVYGEVVVDVGFIINVMKVEFGFGEGVFVFNYINNSDVGYQVDMLIIGDDKDGKVIYDVGYMVFNVGNIYSGKMLVNDGFLIIAFYTVDGVMGMGLSEVIIVNFGMFDIFVLMNSVGDYMLINVFKGDGLM